MRVILFHKPYRVLTQFTPDRPGQATLADYIRVPGVYAAGRLDFESEGLLILTDDGVLQHRLTNPKFAHPRTYWAQVEGTPDEAGLDRLRNGLEIQGYRTRPAKVRRIDPEPEVPPRDPPVRFRREIPTAWLEVILTEGRNRQVRHMTAAVGLPTLRLIRAAIGEVRLEGLAAGCWRDATEQEIKRLRAGGVHAVKISRSPRE